MVSHSNRAPPAPLRNRGDCLLTAGSGGADSDHHDGAEAASGRRCLSRAGHGIGGPVPD